MVLVWVIDIWTLWNRQRQVTKLLLSCCTYTTTPSLFSCRAQSHLHVWAVPRGDEHAVGPNAERQQKELEESLQGLCSDKPLNNLFTKDQNAKAHGLVLMMSKYVINCVSSQNDKNNSFRCTVPELTWWRVFLSLYYCWPISSRMDQSGSWPVPENICTTLDR